MKRFSFRPTLTMKGRTFKGLRGLSGKPSHPPLTDLPIAAFVFAAVLDIVSYAGGTSHKWAKEMWHAGTFVLVMGLAAAVLAALTGLWDAWKTSEAGTQARRTINAHALLMVTSVVLAAGDLAWRLDRYHADLVTPVGIMILSIVMALVVAIGATYGGSLVFEYGFNVETAGDSPVWNKSETDVFPGEKEDASGS